jgi:hypothetical protein
MAGKLIVTDKDVMERIVVGIASLKMEPTTYTMGDDGAFVYVKAHFVPNNFDIKTATSGIKSFETHRDRILGVLQDIEGVEGASISSKTHMGSHDHRVALVSGIDISFEEGQEETAQFWLNKLGFREV